MAKERTQTAINRDVRQLFKTPGGQRVLRELMKQHSVFESTLIITSDPIKLAAMEGARSVVLDIIRVCRGEISPEDFIDDYKTVSTDQAKQIAANKAVEQTRHDPLADDSI